METTQRDSAVNVAYAAVSPHSDRRRKMRRPHTLKLTLSPPLFIFFKCGIMRMILVTGRDSVPEGKLFH